jgi:hypothetical protein
MDILFHGTPRGSRIPVASLKERCPDPLDDRGRQELYYESDPKVVNSMTRIPFSYWFPYWFLIGFQETSLSMKKDHLKNKDINYLLLSI